MKTRIFLKAILALSFFSLWNTSLMAQTGQGVTHTIQAEIKTTGEGTSGLAVTSHEQEATFTFVSTENGFETKLVKGIPFIADTVTEFSRTLGNGQKIYRKSTAILARDSEGRTRREQTIDVVGPYATSAHAHQTIFINDPVAGVSYSLQPQGKTAIKTTVVSHSIKGTPSSGTTGLAASAGASRAETVKHFVVGKASEVGPEEVIVIEGNLTPVSEKTIHTHSKAASPSTMRTESLGSLSFDGVAAEGTRTVETVPAGAIGNDTPIEIVSERWYSHELGVVVKTVRNDPMTGNQVYQLTNIRRMEPAPSLFQLPPDYLVKEANMKILTTINESK